MCNGQDRARVRVAQGALQMLRRGSPADKAGIKIGDLITRVENQTVEGPRDLSRAVARIKPGTRAPLTVFRNGKTQEITVAIDQRQEDRPIRTGAVENSDKIGKRLGLSLAPSPESARRKLGVDSTGGLMVGDVEPGSPAAESGIRPGDVIVAVNNREVAQPSDLADEWAKARGENRPILLRVNRDGQLLFVAVS